MISRGHIDDIAMIYSKCFFIGSEDYNITRELGKYFFKSKSVIIDFNCNNVLLQSWIALVLNLRFQ